MIEQREKLWREIIAELRQLADDAETALENNKPIPDAVTLLHEYEDARKLFGK